MSEPLSEPLFLVGVAAGVAAEDEDGGAALLEELWEAPDEGALVAVGAGVAPELAGLHRLRLHLKQKQWVCPQGSAKSQTPVSSSGFPLVSKPSCQALPFALWATILEEGTTSDSDDEGGAEDDDH